MNFRMNLGSAPEGTLRGEEPVPGDIYSKAGGTPGVWWVIAVRGARCIVLSVDPEGEITGASAYGLHYFRDNCHRRIGCCQLPDIAEPIWNIPR